MRSGAAMKFYLQRVSILEVEADTQEIALATVNVFHPLAAQLSLIKTLMVSNEFLPRNPFEALQLPPFKLQTKGEKE